MLNLNRSNFQAHPFHLVSPSPWPLYTSISLLSLTTSAVLSFHGFAYAEYNLMLSLTAFILSMAFWLTISGAESSFTVVESTALSAKSSTTYLKAYSSLDKCPLPDESNDYEDCPYFYNCPFYVKCIFCDKCPKCAECTFCKCEESTPSDQGPFSDDEPFIN